MSRSANPRRLRMVAFVAATAVVAGLGFVASVSASAAPVTVITPTVQQVSTDTLPAFTTNGATMQHRTEMESDTFSFGSTIVSAFQVGRNGAGYGAQGIGFATSTNSGQTWTHGILPHLTQSSPNPNPAYPVVVNQSVAYDAKHGQWIIPSVTYVSTTPSAFVEQDLMVNRSADGVTWGDAALAVSMHVDKAWGVCDNTASSPHYGTCYIAYSQIGLSDQLAITHSTDGGVTWSAPVSVPAPGSTAPATGYNTNPVVQPGGRLVVVATDVKNGANGSLVISTTSDDGGATFTAPSTVATIQYHTPLQMRAKNKPSTDVDAAGTVYAAWSDCRFHTACAKDDIVYATSADGQTWGAPKSIGVSTGEDKFIPGFAVEPGTSGGQAHLSAVYYTDASGSCATTCAIQAQYVSSYDGGTTWTAPYAINATPFPVTWLAGSYSGGPPMVGDYLSISYAHGSPTAVVSLAGSAPVTSGSSTVYDESEWALTLPPHPAAGTHVAVSPSRLLDTRTGNGGAVAPPNGAVHLQVLGRGGVPASGVSSVVLNVTVVSPTSSGYLTVYADQTTRPTSSNLNFKAGQTVPNLVVAPVGQDGKVAIYNGSSGSSQLLADVSGYFVDGSPTVPGAFTSVAPSRVLDTRTGNGGTVALPHDTVSVQVLGKFGVPTSGVSAVVLNVTAVSPTSSGYLTVFADQTTRPTSSNLNFTAKQTVPNLVVAPVGPDGKVAIYNGSSGSTQMLADVSGYFLAGSAVVPGAFTSVAPSRVLDTRVGNGGTVAAAHGTVSVQVLGRGGVPASGVSSVVLNVTAVSPTSSGYLTVYASQTTRPTSSNLNFTAGQTVPNLVIAPVGSDGKVALYNGSGGSTQLLADVSGYILD